MAYESLERYRKAYVDYKTVLQIDNGVQAAHDSVNRYKHPEFTGSWRCDMWNICKLKVTSSIVAQAHSGFVVTTVLEILSASIWEPKEELGHRLRIN